ncbi:MAG: alpha/beta fold hydrolase [Moraxella sp.]|nr:alpha/beta fold hydrolase [Moraxella sp.]
MTATIPTPTTLLVHGLHQNPWFMQPLANKLTAMGFVTHTFRYYSLRDNIKTHAIRLNQALLEQHHSDEPIHLVAHSLGGLVIRQFLADYPDWHAKGRIGRIVTLGTPHMGSICADYTKRILPFLVGGSYANALDGNCPPLDSDVRLGVIAGNKSLGLGQPILAWHSKRNPNIDHAHDGTVYVFETKLPNASEHLILPVTHTGLLTEQTTAVQTAHFLNHGRFCR